MRTPEDVYNEGKFDPHEIRTFVYTNDHNWFEDECGNIVYDIHRYVHPRDIFLFKKQKMNCTDGFWYNSYIVVDRTNSFLVELLYIEKVGS